MSLAFDRFREGVQLGLRCDRHDGVQDEPTPGNPGFTCQGAGQECLVVLMAGSDIGDDMFGDFERYNASPLQNAWNVYVI